MLDMTSNEFRRVGHRAVDLLDDYFESLPHRSCCTTVPEMWVEHRFGLGYTLNFGNWRAWLLIIGMILGPMIASRLLF